MKKKYISLQALRGIAAWMVVFHHYMQIAHHFEGHGFLGKLFTRYGAFGIDIFFVISGFVMFLSAHKATTDGLAFFFRRLFRVVPTYWFYTTLLALLVALLPQAFFFTQYDASSLAASYLFFPSENPSGIGLYPLLMVGWTLIFEMFFYTVLSVCIAISKKHAILLCSAAVLLCPLTYPESLPYGSVIGNKLLWEFLCGFLIAYVFTHVRAMLEKHATATLAISGLVFVAFASLGTFTDYKLLSRVMVSGSVVTAFISINDWRLFHAGLGKWLSAAGDWSYSTYLCHIITISLLTYLVQRIFSTTNDVVLLTLVILSTALLSRASYRYMENNPGVLRLREFLTDLAEAKHKPEVTRD
ncbi:acyltransferase family protein [Pseudodesulfovibrio sp.]|uniref:acyltransferase family protein n=1 Tax=unclassified Pseudodesulfovibrio TaxID=2661612 RepID=UPI003B00F2FC